MEYVTLLTQGVNGKPTEVYAVIDEDTGELYCVQLWQECQMVGVIDLPLAKGKQLDEVESVAIALAESFVQDKYGIVLIDEDDPAVPRLSSNVLPLTRNEGVKNHV